MDWSTSLAFTSTRDSPDVSKFSVYNAGQKEIVICRGDRIFMIWYASLDRETDDPYPGSKPTQNEISAQDLSRAAGDVASPSQLFRELDDLRHSLTNWKWMVGIFLGIATSLFGGFFLLFLRGSFNSQGGSSGQLHGASLPMTPSSPSSSVAPPTPTLVSSPPPQPARIAPTATAAPTTSCRRRIPQRDLRHGIG